MEDLIVKSASMLVTKNGFCVKLEMFNGEPICFFVNNNFEHVVWKLTLKSGLILDKREFWRMRKDYKLDEVSLSDKQFKQAEIIGQKVFNDPFHGLKKSERRKLNIPDHYTVVEQQERLAEPVGRLLNDPKSNPVTFGNISALQNVFEKLKQAEKVA